MNSTISFKCKGTANKHESRQTNHQTANKLLKTERQSSKNAIAQPASATRLQMKHFLRRPSNACENSAWRVCQCAGRVSRHFNSAKPSSKLSLKSDF